MSCTISLLLLKDDFWVLFITLARQALNQWRIGCACICLCVFVFGLHWMRACRAAWTGRCRSGSCACWGSAAWPASSPGQSSGSASYSGPPRPVFAAGVGTDNNPP